MSSASLSRTSQQRQAWTDADTDRLIRELGRAFRHYADPKYRVSLQRFFKEPITVFGVRTPIFRQIASDYFARIKKLPKDDILRICEAAVALPEGEYRGIAFNWAERLWPRFMAADFTRFERWLKRYVHNWGSCDSLCGGALGQMVLRFPGLRPRVKAWAKSPNRWLRRASAVALILSVRRGRAVRDAFSTADILLEDTDDMVQKGYGWLLKEVSNRNPEQVLSYVMMRRARMPRTALRYAIEKLPPAQRRQAMATERST